MIVTSTASILRSSFFRNLSPAPPSWLCAIPIAHKSASQRPSASLRNLATTTARLPLSDVRIIAVEQFGAGPFGTTHLCDIGAEVIKVEDPNNGGDVARYVPSPAKVAEDNIYFECFNRNKKSISLDLSKPAGKKVFEDLVKVSDAVYSNLRGDVPKKIGITYEQLKHVNPKIVCVSLSAFGMSGPRLKNPGYDPVLQGLCGWMDVTGDPDGPPTKSGLSLVDYAGGVIAALSLVSGVHAARRDGAGMDCDVSLYDTAMNFLGYPATFNLSTGGKYRPERSYHSAHPTLIPFQACPTSDGWITIACAKEKFWQRLCGVFGKPEWTTDPKFKDFAARHQNRTLVVNAIEAVTQTKTSAEWLELLEDAGVPCGPVNSVHDALRDAHLPSRDLLVEYDHPTLGTVRHIGSPVKVGNMHRVHQRGPMRNEHGDELMRGLLGYDSAAIQELRSDGAFGKSADDSGRLEAAM
ncbi:L-carnitine dehydratase/bile acid-inducible protein F [Gonapodya prolifera JEL478]|uniref:L-carnitine dehydratase/bile acid-inducible protein F n=1 Tax=Gonapodya prolifera (strain JEL478) TaxID=1344416 RepID=A0A139AMA1_GONPJ|nr:L-carnitine dehydratase/bile acid-inducible protein F [Gonapodya prolifera JEL478]|eukprot:KXS17643.1 L-carnitine dehydratase/bile acid-inducible protein F [Gonapodya prolifera JEL478]